MKATVTLEVEVYDEQFRDLMGSEPNEDALAQFISDELGWSFSSFYGVKITNKTITDKTIKAPEVHVIDPTK